MGAGHVPDAPLGPVAADVDCAEESEAPSAPETMLDALDAYDAAKADDSKLLSGEVFVVLAFHPLAVSRVEALDPPGSADGIEVDPRFVTTYVDTPKV